MNKAKRQIVIGILTLLLFVCVSSLTACKKDKVPDDKKEDTNQVEETIGIAEDKDAEETEQEDVKKDDTNMSDNNTDYNDVVANGNQNSNSGNVSGGSTDSNDSEQEENSDGGDSNAATLIPGESEDDPSKKWSPLR